MTTIQVGTKAGVSDTTEIVYLSPSEAKELLERNQRNRPISRNHVDKLKADMVAGRWVYNGEPLKLNHELRLLDGQHRLTALSEMPEGTLIKFLIVYGLEDHAQATMDQNKTRGAADMMVMDDLASASDATRVAAAIRAYILWQNDQLFTDSWRRTITNPEIVEWSREHPVETQMFSIVLSITGVPRIKARTGLVIAILGHFYLLDCEDAGKFTEMLTTGVGLAFGNPVHTLRERLDRIRDSKVKTSDREFIAMFVVAWNAHRKGKSLQKITFRNGLTQDNFPVAR